MNSDENGVLAIIPELFPVRVQPDFVVGKGCILGLGCDEALTCTYALQYAEATKQPIVVDFHREHGTRSLTVLVPSSVTAAWGPGGFQALGRVAKTATRAKKVRVVVNDCDGLWVAHLANVPSRVEFAVIDKFNALFAPFHESARAEAVEYDLARDVMDL